MIREARERLKIPQKVLALELEIGQPYLSDLEADHRQWRMDLFERAKAALIKLANEQ